MIARVWRGWTAVADADMYETHFRHAVLPHLHDLPGFGGAHLLRRVTDNEVEFVAITRFESLAALRAFAGDDYEEAVIAPEARDVLARFDRRCAHYEIVTADDVLPLDPHQDVTK